MSEDSSHMALMPQGGPIIPAPQAPANQNMMSNNVDLPMLAFLNAVDAPQDIKDKLWGYMTATIAFSKYDPRLARASIYGMKVQLAELRMSVPFREQTAEFEIMMNNVLNLYKALIYKAKLPGTERQLLVQQFSEVSQVTSGPAQKKRFLGFL